MEPCQDFDTHQKFRTLFENLLSGSLTQFSGSLKAFLKQSWISQNRHDFTVIAAWLMLKGDAQYSREEVVEVSSLSRNWCAWVALGLALGLDISSASAFALLCFCASPRTLGLGHALGLTLGLRLGLALVWASTDHPHSIACTSFHIFSMSDLVRETSKAEQMDTIMLTDSLVFCSQGWLTGKCNNATCWQVQCTSYMLHADRYMLLEKKILALREELEEREAAMQVPYPLSFIRSLI